MVRGAGSATEAVKAVGKSIRAFRHLLGIFFYPKQKLRHGERFLTLLEGNSFNLVFDAFEKHPEGRALLEAMPDTERILADRIDLGQRPAGSFARSYLDFLVSNGFDAADINEVVKKAPVVLSTDPKRVWLRARISATHDVRHVLADYGPDTFGELCLMAFRMGQVGHPGVAVLVVIMTIWYSLLYGPVAAFKAIAEAYRRGRSAVLLDLYSVESNLSEPLESCRTRLGLTPPHVYQTLVSARLRGGVFKRRPATPLHQEPST